MHDSLDVQIAIIASHTWADSVGSSSNLHDMIRSNFTKAYAVWTICTQLFKIQFMHASLWVGLVVYLRQILMHQLFQHQQKKCKKLHRKGTKLQRTTRQHPPPRWAASRDLSLQVMRLQNRSLAEAFRASRSWVQTLRPNLWSHPQQQSRRQSKPKLHPSSQWKRRLRRRVGQIPHRHRPFGSAWGDSQPRSFAHLAVPALHLRLRQAQQPQAVEKMPQVWWLKKGHQNRRQRRQIRASHLMMRTRMTQVTMMMMMSTKD